MKGITEKETYVNKELVCAINVQQLMIKIMYT